MVKKYNLINNKKGWVTIVETFVAIVLLTGVLLVISNSNSSAKSNLQEEISKRQVAVLRDIQLNDTLRAEILGINIDAMPVEWENFDSNAPLVKQRIEDLSPKELNCSAQICIINEPCVLDDISGREIYAKSVIISANATIYSPRQLKLFCTKE